MAKGEGESGENEGGEGRGVLWLTGDEDSPWWPNLRLEVSGGSLFRGGGAPTTRKDGSVRR